MEKRLYFVAGDILSNIVVGIVSVGVTTLLIGGSMGMWPGMLAGMVIGMVLAMGLSMGVLAPRLGIMEIMMPYMPVIMHGIMISMMPCMMTGMYGGMWGGMVPLGVVDTLQWGAATGVTVLTIMYLLNAAISGPQKLPEHNGEMRNG